MTKAETQRLDVIEAKLDNVSDKLSVVMDNHIPHLTDSVDEAKNMAEQAAGLANTAAKSVTELKWFVGAAAVVISIVVAIVQCLG